MVQMPLIADTIGCCPTPEHAVHTDAHTIGCCAAHQGMLSTRHRRNSQLEDELAHARSNIESLEGEATQLEAARTALAASEERAAELAEQLAAAEALAALLQAEVAQHAGQGPAAEEHLPVSSSIGPSEPAPGTEAAADMQQAYPRGKREAGLEEGLAAAKAQIAALQAEQVTLRITCTEQVTLHLMATDGAAEEAAQKLAALHAQHAITLDALEHAKSMVWQLSTAAAADSVGHAAEVGALRAQVVRQREEGTRLGTALAQSGAVHAVVERQLSASLAEQTKLTLQLAMAKEVLARRTSKGASSQAPLPARVMRSQSTAPEQLEKAIFAHEELTSVPSEEHKLTGAAHANMGQSQPEHLADESRTASNTAVASTALAATVAEGVSSAAQSYEASGEPSASAALEGQGAEEEDAAAAPAQQQLPRVEIVVRRITNPLFLAAPHDGSAAAAADADAAGAVKRLAHDGPAVDGAATHEAQQEVRAERTDDDSEPDHDHVKTIRGREALLLAQQLRAPSAEDLGQPLLPGAPTNSSALVAAESLPAHKPWSLKSLSAALARDVRKGSLLLEASGQGGSSSGELRDTISADWGGVTVAHAAAEPLLTQQEPPRPLHTGVSPGFHCTKTTALKTDHQLCHCCRIPCAWRHAGSQLSASNLRVLQVQMEGCQAAQGGC